MPESLLTALAVYGAISILSDIMRGLDKLAGWVEHEQMKDTRLERLRALPKEKEKPRG